MTEQENRRRWSLGALAAAGALLLSACLGSVSPSGPSVTARPICAIVPMLHAGRDALVAAGEAAHAGQLENAKKRAAEAKSIADQATAAFGALGSDPGDEGALRAALLSESVGLSQLASVYPMATSPEDLAAFVDDPAALLVTAGMLGNVDSAALHGRDGTGGICPNLALGSPLPTFAFANPTAGPVPPGTWADQTAAVLLSLGLRRAAGIEFGIPPSVPWPKMNSVFVPDPTVLTNRSAKEVWYPVDATIRRWDGRSWVVAFACEANTSAKGLCSVRDTNLKSLGPGQSDATPLGWADGAPRPTDLSLPAVPPGTYAIVVPIWRANPQPDDATTSVWPTEAIVAILTVTARP